jgi:hypothetical protein
MSVFHGLSGGRTGQSPIIGLVPAGAGLPGGAAAGTLTAVLSAFAQRLPRHGRTL